MKQCPETTRVIEYRGLEAYGRDAEVTLADYKEHIRPCGGIAGHEGSHYAFFGGEKICFQAEERQ
ncbi:MAG: hypothetical protein J3T61_03255 [Candidatus Brocadiales bacterium]|nr:hypothetical protein [Candidatus Bathyanammoxibius sp.]